MKVFVALLALFAVVNGKLLFAFRFIGKQSVLFCFHAVAQDNCDRCQKGIMKLGEYLLTPAEIEKEIQALLDLVCTEFTGAEADMCIAGKVLKHF